MLAAEHCPDLFANVAPSKDELLEIHYSKISLHHAKKGYNYPTIRLPHTFSRLAGLPTRIYQTVHKGALAFLVVISPNEKGHKKLRIPRLDMAEVAGPNPAEPTGFWLLLVDRSVESLLIFLTDPFNKII